MKTMAITWMMKREMMVQARVIVIGMINDDDEEEDVSSDAT